MIEGVSFNSLKRIAHPKGDIYHALKASDESFSSFGEAYFSAVHQGEIKGWKLHKKMEMNLIVPVGTIKFVLFDERDSAPTKGQFYEIEVGEGNYGRLYVPAGIWMGFMGLGSSLNLLLNIASIEHDPEEAVNKSLEDIYYSW